MNTALTDAKRTYLYQGLIGKEKSSLWDDANSSFWEDMFLGKYFYFFLTKVVREFH